MKKFSRFATAAGVFALGVGLAGASIAAADESGKAIDGSTIDKTAQVSMTIHKYEGQPLSPEAYTFEKPEGLASMKAVKGIEFTVQRVMVKDGADTVTPDSSKFWAAIKDLNADQITTEGTENGNLIAGEKYTVKTNAAGEACIGYTGKCAEVTDAGSKAVDDKIVQGLYLVTESNATATDPAKSYTAGKPFLITLPLYNAAKIGKEAWVYDTNVYPKNQESSLKKEQVDIKAGEVVTYKISVDINKFKKEATYNKPLVVTDIIPDSLECVPNTCTTQKLYTTKAITGVTKDTADATGPSKGLFEVTATYTPAKSGANATATIAATEKDTLDKISDGATDNKIVMLIDLKANKQPTKTAINKGMVDWPDGKTDKPGNDGDDTPGNSPNKFVNVSFTKIGEGDDSAKLAGAVFEFYACKKDVNGKLTVYKSDASGVTAAEPLKGYNETNKTNAPNAAGTDTQFTSSAEGIVAAYYLKDVTQIKPASFETTDSMVLCALEVKAPAGYVAAVAPIELKVTPATDKPSENPGVGALTGDTNKFKNSKDSIIPGLPATGAAGVTLLLLVGGGMVIAGVLMRRRREEA